jgi:hypothetical protein
MEKWGFRQHLPRSEDIQSLLKSLLDFSRLSSSFTEFLKWCCSEYSNSVISTINTTLWDIHVCRTCNKTKSRSGGLTETSLVRVLQNGTLLLKAVPALRLERAQEDLQTRKDVEGTLCSE